MDIRKELTLLKVIDNAPSLLDLWSIAYPGKYIALLMFITAWYAEPVGIPVKLK
jgi:hypothetical protein